MRWAQQNTPKSGKRKQGFLVEGKEQTNEGPQNKKLQWGRKEVEFDTGFVPGTSR